MAKLVKIKKKIAKFPDAPGVYQFWCKNKITYVGKATSLRDRVKSYFGRDILATRGPKISRMLERFDKVNYIKTDSVLEALILEANLIKRYQPEANTIDKDDKSFNHVVITDENFPRVLVVRGRELEKFATIYRSKFKNDKLDILQSFGPFTNGGQLKEALKLIRRIFPYRDKCIPAGELKPNQIPRPCFNRQLGLCPGVCTGEISKTEYAKQIRNIFLFFEGKKKQLMKNLEKQMKGFAKVHEFERANIAKRTLFALKHIQDIALLKSDINHNPYRGAENMSPASHLCHGVNEKVFRVESYDIAHTSGQNVVGAMVVVEDGEVKKSDYRKFKIKWFDGTTENDFSHGVNDTKSLGEVLERRLGHIEWPMPDLIVVDGGVAQKNIAGKIIKQYGLKIPVVSVVKDERHKPREILGDLGTRAPQVLEQSSIHGKKFGTGQVGGWTEIERQILLANSEAHRFAIGYHKKSRGRIV